MFLHGDNPRKAGNFGIPKRGNFGIPKWDFFFVPTRRAFAWGQSAGSCQDRPRLVGSIAPAWRSS
ncbi:hypothetical protein ELH42_22140 [Rhizobium ruizarguesonis]|jgi:hypothetical protein|nr:hypothetical protein ELH85_26920 [Rhizobium ruizarguesonis]TAZ80975.1 hypothetical protein ELH68_25695 [Rhizobium ruizarguesonis]TBA07362.1 hypothetical protein ELH64_24220 [Rhizobium ruizarguesonis]TBA28749.1 hypothetical protein ELH61_24320 [Rhizobium ruizarguesonis]TBA45348.1 hypothetical protein ELH62_24525 [Rhizobium ruizarguesonis]